jgi:hypothetical protein
MGTDDVVHTLSLFKVCVVCCHSWQIGSVDHLVLIGVRGLQVFYEQFTKLDESVKIDC